MRKIFAVLLLAALLALTACDKEPLYLDGADTAGETAAPGFTYTDSDDQPCAYGLLSTDAFGPVYAEGYIYFVTGNKYANLGLGTPSTLMRYNVKSGNITQVCPDPLCKHDTPECPLFGIGEKYFIKNDKVFFRRYYYHYTADGLPTLLCSEVVYDMQSHKLSLIKELGDKGGYFGRELFTDKYRYYFDWITDDPDNPFNAFCRTDLNTYKDEILAKFGYEDAVYLAAVGDRLYFTDYKDIYSTNADYGDKQTVIEGLHSVMACDGEYFYYGANEQKQGYIYHDIRRIKMDGTDDMPLGIRTNEIVLTDKYIYYSIMDEISIGKVDIRGYAASEVVLYGSEIRRCAHDGSGDELVFKFDGELASTRFYGFIAVGNYLYGAFSSWADADGDGVFEDGDNYDSTQGDTYSILRIDVTTGEPYYITAEQ